MSRAWAALVLAVLLGTAGCGGEDPSASPPPSSPTVSSSTAPTPPALPAAAKKDTKAGAIAFVRHYIATYNFAQKSGQTKALHALAAAGCHSCAQVESAIRKIYDSGGTFRGGQWTVKAVLADPSANGSWLVTVGGHMAPSTVLPADSEPRHAKGGRASADFHLKFEKKWLITQWNRL